MDLWVQELITEPDNPVIFYKPQGTPHDHLKDEDFLLCLQTAFQRNMMIKYASKIICIDSTHNITQYDFMLTTVLVLDEFEEAVPVVWAVSNREDAEILEVIFQSVKRCCGQNFTRHIYE